MDKARILALANYYDGVLGPNGRCNGPRKAPENVHLSAFLAPEDHAHAHLLAMIPELREMLADTSQDRTEKCMRWLGFIQGVLWSTSVFTLEELKDHSRPDKPAPVYRITPSP
jgi:hypothetical protein